MSRRLPLLFFFCVSAVQAQEDPDLALAYGGQELISLATGGTMPIQKAPAVASVITAEDIKSLGATDLDQVLETVPGLHVSRNGNQWLPLYSLRGILTQFNPEVLMMVNGIPITSGFTGDRGRMWGGFPLEHVARIEVIRGPGSALYGAEAVSGVINIITKDAGDIDGSEFGLRAGSFGTYDVWAQHGGQWGGFDAAVYLRLGTTKGFDGRIAADAQTGLDTAFGTHVSRAPGPLNTGFDAIDLRLDLARDKWRLRAGYKGRPDYETGAGVADALDPDARMDAKYVNADLTWHDPQFRPGWDVSAQAGLYHISEPNTDITLFPAGSALPLAQPGGVTSSIGMVGRPQHWERQARLELSALYTGSATHKLRLGVGWFRDDLYKVTESKNFTFVNVPGVGAVPMCINLACSMVEASEANGLLFLAPHARNAWNAYIQDEWTLAPDWTLTAGLRHDRYSDFGGTTNPRLALVWDTAYNLTSKLMLGRAFRAPSFVELYTINNPTALGNPDLKPETIDTLELAFAWQPSTRLKTGLNLFHYRMDDVIRFLPNADPTTGSTAQNAGKQHGSGLELEASWDATDSLRLSGNFALQRSIDERSNRDAGLAPHRQLYLRADWRVQPGWTLNGQVNWVMDRKRQAGDGRPQIDDYATVDLTLRGGLPRKGWEAAFSVRNLFDADAREPTAGASASNLPYDIPLPGRTVYLEFRHRLQ
jgi:outer membrane receptor for ferrienterochelin and colicins